MFQHILMAMALVAAPALAETDYVVPAGTKIALSLIKSISTKGSQEGDTVYLETAFPVLVSGKIVIPVGSYVTGTVTSIKKPGRVKGRGEVYLRFDSLILRNGITRDFRARLGGMDGDTHGKLDRDEGKVTSDGNKAGDARTVGEVATAGASIGVIAGHAASHAGMGAGVGAAAGAAAGLIGVLATRGPDAELTRGSELEMVLDRPLTYNESELYSENAPPRGITPAAPAPAPAKGTGIIVPRQK